MQTTNHHENTEPMYGAPPTTGAYTQSGAPVQQAGYPSTHNTAAYGSNPATTTTYGDSYGTHPRNNVNGYNHNESTVGKIKDHIKGNHSHNPQNGGGFGAGYTGNDHGHVNHHKNNHSGVAPTTGAGVGATSTNQPLYGAPANEKPSTMDKIKNAVSGDKHHNESTNPTYGAPAAGVAGAGATGTYDPSYNNTTHTTAAGVNPTYGAPATHNSSTHNPLSSNTTQPQYGAPSTNPVVANDHHHNNTHSSHHNHHSDGTTKPSLGDKISGTMDTIVGKMTHNDAKVAQGEVKKVYGKDAADAGLANARAHEGTY